MTTHPTEPADAVLLPTFWTMHTANGFYPIQPSNLCKPEDHGRLNDHVLRILDAEGNIIWEGTKQ